MVMKSMTAVFLPQRGRQRLVTGVVTGLLLLTGGCARPQRPTLGGPTTSVDPGPAIKIPEGSGEISTTRAAPRWETVANLSGGSAPAPAQVAIAADAIQWRVKWSCESGSLKMTTTPAPRKPGPLMSAGCPGRGEAFSILTGPVSLAVEATAPWSATVEQQVETPLDEEALPEMATAPALAEGTFYGIERKGGGTARIYRLGDGRRFLRLEGFTVSANTDLFVWASEAPEPTTSAEATAVPHVVLAELKATIGSHNYELPADLPTERIGSIVIWCQPVAIAYTAASLATS